ncbi:MAG: chemotaxis protein CheW [Thermodesulfobacteriota bacterium]
MGARQFVTFRLGDHFLGLDVLEVREINRVLETTPVPPAPAFVRGLINLRGQVITVLDLGVRLGLAPLEITPETHNVILKADRVGLLVDAIGDVATVEENEIEAPPANLVGLEDELINGVVQLEGELLVILDAAKVLEHRAGQAPDQAAGPRPGKKGNSDL